jgi:hypothetical protein
MPYHFECRGWGQVESTSNATDAVGLTTDPSDESVDGINRVVGVGGAGITPVLGEAAVPTVAVATVAVATVTRGSRQFYPERSNPASVLGYLMRPFIPSGL